METAERGEREGGGPPDSEEHNLVIGRLSEDRGYSSPTEGSQHCHHSTAHTHYTLHTIPSGCRVKTTTKGGTSTINSAKYCEEKIASLP